MEETDLSKCNATDSSLWEIKSLQSHALPEIAYMAKFIDRDLPKSEWDLNLALELTLEDVRILVIIYIFKSELTVLSMRFCLDVGKGTQTENFRRRRTTQF